MLIFSWSLNDATEDAVHRRGSIASSVAPRKVKKASQLDVSASMHGRLSSVGGRLSSVGGRLSTVVGSQLNTVRKRLSSLGTNMLGGHRRSTTQQRRRSTWIASRLANFSSSTLPGQESINSVAVSYVQLSELAKSTVIKVQEVRLHCSKLCEIARAADALSETSSELHVHRFVFFPYNSPQSSV